uniref:LisH domain and HEAT repeat containing protein n=1 Tax=Echinococcus granulosus TaxID=6210 RepID=A0A068WKH1_ECHGR|nr:lisH domain and HEAT repeat containing protein [Echinococcus granulosus]
MALFETTIIDQGTKPETQFSDYLLKDKFFLTALEFHYELLERGISCDTLEEFFSNPENFYRFDSNRSEVISTNSHVSLSTSDSVDLRTGSEDQNSFEEQLKGNVDPTNYFKVFEFELRKRNEEIKSLRRRLTTATVGGKATEPLNSSTPSNGECYDSKDSGPASNTEIRALRFLINEHLLNNGYKLSAVQFAEECEVEDQQDLDDWDDVGLTCNRPPNLLMLLRSSWMLPCHKPLRSGSSTPHSARPQATVVNATAEFTDEAVQTELSAGILDEELETNKTALSALRCNFEATKAELEVSRQQIGDLRGKVMRIEAENVSLAQESTYWRNQLLCLKRDYPDLVGTTVVKASKNAAPAQSLSNGYVELGTEDADSAEKSSENGHIKTSSPVPSPPCADPLASKVTAPLPKLVINNPQFIRRCAPEFVCCASELLPPVETEEVPLEVSRLADTLDEIIVAIGSQIQSILKHLPDDRKTLALPLLIQAICLHPDAEVRDQLLRTLFNLFTDSPEADTKEVEIKRAGTILHQCRDLATCLGPQRIESELLPQIWSQLNERPSNSLRKLLISACGVIAPATPSRLRSSLLLSILLQSIEEEKAEEVRAVALRSLAAVVALMEDRDKVPQLVTTFDTVFRADWTHSPPATTALPCPHVVTYGCLPCLVSRCSMGTCPSVITASCNWLLPTVAQWCLEVGSFNDLLLKPWLQRLMNLCFTLDVSKSRPKSGSVLAAPRRLKAAFSTDELFCIMTVLNRLVPFVFVSVLESLTLLRPDTEDCDDLVLDDVVEDVKKAEGEDLEENGSTGIANSNTVDERRSSVDLDQCVYLFVPQYILGKRRYEQLLECFNHILSGSKIICGEAEQQKQSASEDAENETSATTMDIVSMSTGREGDEWPAMDAVRQHLFCVAQMLRTITPCPNTSSTTAVTKAVETTEGHEYLEQDPISPQEFLALMQMQFEDTYWTPWHLQPTSSILTLCKELCLYVSLFGKAFGAAAVQSHLGEPFHTLLMERSVQGYFEFDLKALPSGAFAGYCCLLASTKFKSELNKVKMLIANAIFLHSRDSCSLHGVRAGIMTLCHSEDAMMIADAVLLPALRSCASCADPAVRRTASNIFYTLIAYLSDAVDFDSAAAATSKKLTPTPAKQHNRQSSWVPATPSLLEECWQLVSQLARDDYASVGTAAFPESNSTGATEIPPLDEHSADWSCISVALGPLFCLYSRMLRSSPYVTDMDLMQRRNLSENSRIAEQALGLIGRLMSMVSAEGQSPLDPSAVQFLVQRQNWETLVSGLLQVANRLFLTCPEEFRDTRILPWLYRLTEINNMIPDLEKRTRLGQRLVGVFSTAAFCLGTEAVMMTWVMPGLDRLRLDFVEAGEKGSAEGLEQLSSDLRQRLANYTSPSPVQPIAADTTKNSLRQKFANLLNSASDSPITHGKKFPFSSINRRGGGSQNHLLQDESAGAVQPSLLSTPSSVRWGHLFDDGTVAEAPIPYRGPL